MVAIADMSQEKQERSKVCLPELATSPLHSNEEKWLLCKGDVVTHVFHAKFGVIIV
ncbi:MAG: hypothetical protein V7K35_24415 [Nostoc sp.]|uniref:hypothetical protein n=1 Tax=Nostoc sp. TaxID=1180 RepID=UPI002FF5D82A